MIELMGQDYAGIHARAACRHRLVPPSRPPWASKQVVLYMHVSEPAGAGRVMISETGAIGGTGSARFVERCFPPTSMAMPCSVRRWLGQEARVRSLCGGR